MPEGTVILKSDPGVKRDGTKFEGNFYTDAQWVRFQRGLPRKMGGYRSITKYLTEIGRGITSFTQQNLVYTHSGGSSTLERFTIDGSGNASVVSDRTPTTLVDSPLNQWMFDYQFDSSSAANSIIAHVSPNLSCICNDEGGQIFYGDVLGTSPLVEITLPVGANATGGIVALHPYLFYYGTAGIIGHSVPGEPTDMTGIGSNIARPWGQKIVKGLPLRAGAGSAPAGIFWAYDAVIRATFNGGTTSFQYDVIATETSIMSENAVIDYDGVFFWAGMDRFLMFNGVVREVPNAMNLNWFFDGLNTHQRSKVFAYKVPRFGEVWWAYPRGDATECTHAVVYNVRENTWYDTALPNTGRSSGIYNNSLMAPVMTGVIPTEAGYKVWIHEKGVDEIDGQNVNPINSYFETADLSYIATQNKNTQVRITEIEPDFIQSGPMTVQVTGRANARAPEVYSSVFSFPEVANQPFEQIVMLKEQRRELRVKFSSNAVNGNFQMGQIIGRLTEGDGTALG
jgi:hypothetical protein